MRRSALLVDDFVTVEEREHVIDWYHEHSDKVGKFKNTTTTYRMIGDSNKDGCPVEEATPIVRNIWDRLDTFARNEYSCELQWAQVYKWPPGSFMDMHHDVASRVTTLTSVLWLNEDFMGGELQFRDGTTFVPVSGRAIWYDGIKNHHRVRKVNRGTRWAIAAWYKDIECNTNSMKKT